MTSRPVIISPEVTLRTVIVQLSWRELTQPSGSM